MLNLLPKTKLECWVGGHCVLYVFSPEEIQYQSVYAKFKELHLCISGIFVYFR